MKDENKQTIAELVNEIQAIEKQLQIECGKCDGTGKPRTKTGKPPEKGLGNAACRECLGTGILGNKLDQIEKNILLMKKDISKISSDLKTYMNRQFAEIRILPPGKSPEIVKNWEDYTGVFYLDGMDEKKIVLEKAKKHFDTYFQDAIYHRNKKLGIFITSPRSGKRLVESMETN